MASKVISLVRGIAVSLMSSSVVLTTLSVILVHYGAFHKSVVISFFLTSSYLCFNVDGLSRKTLNAMSVLHFSCGKIIGTSIVSFVFFILALGVLAPTITNMLIVAGILLLFSIVMTVIGYWPYVGVRY